MTTTIDLPRVIQGGMGVGVSSWELAGAVAQAGQLGVVSGTALDTVLARRLQDGDADGSARRALRHFPVPAVADRLLAKYFRSGGRAAGQPYVPTPSPVLAMSRAAQELTVAGNFVEVWLAKQGHAGLVGVNYLEKVQLVTPYAVLGAMLAGVDYVLMGAGIPREIPALLRDLAAGRPGEVGADVAGSADRHPVRVDPAALLGPGLPPMKRPAFLAIVSADVLASYLARDPDIRPDGFVIEGPRAGGHNAPPRGRLQLAGGEPVYGPRDDADPAKVAALGLPFWLAGGYGSPAAVAEALAAGAVGVQVGTLFALAAESGLAPSLRRQLADSLGQDGPVVRTDASASPTGFPFKVAQLPGTLSDPTVYGQRPRLCDLGYLRTPYVRPDGRVGYRCPSEPVHMYVRKGGDAADTEGRACLCNALTANIGLGQTRRSGYAEVPLVTLGTDLDGVRQIHQTYPEGWTATQAVDWLLSGTLPALSGAGGPAVAEH